MYDKKITKMTSDNKISMTKQRSYSNTMAKPSKLAGFLTLRRVKQKNQNNIANGLNNKRILDTLLFMGSEPNLSPVKEWSNKKSATLRPKNRQSYSTVDLTEYTKDFKVRIITILKFMNVVLYT